MEKLHMIDGLNLNGEIGELLRAVTNNWLIGIRQSNPAILDMFLERDKKPYRDLLPWSGEFAGKYITGAYYVYQSTHDEKLYKYVMDFIDELIKSIDDDGYIGCFQKECRLSGAYSQSPEKIGDTWDAWAHYHIMYGLYIWYTHTKEQYIFNAVLKIADLFVNTFYNSNNRRIIDMGSSEMNLAPLHIFTLVYIDTKNDKYLALIKEIEKDIKTPQAGNYIEHSLNGLEFYQCPKPRWESLHVIMGILNMSECLNDDKYASVAKQIFYSILKTDIHNTGGFSTNEQAIGNPFDNGAIELCCVIAYNALACDILKKTGDVKIVDFLEKSLYNAILGSFSTSGRWSAYNTPMEGVKKANYHDIVFQSRPGSPDLNCCSANAARGIGQISEWAFMQEDETVFINAFEQSSVNTDDGLSISINGDYPANAKIEITIASKVKKRVAIRIPSWSVNTRVHYDCVDHLPKCGEYFYIEKQWNEDKITIDFDFSPYTQDGQGDYTAKRSIFAGPILYGWDLSLNENMDFDNIAPITNDDIEGISTIRTSNGNIILKCKNGINLCDFYHLGLTGSEYKTWFA